jgi:hypothetical protein
MDHPIHDAAGAVEPSGSRYRSARSAAVIALLIDTSLSIPGAATQSPTSHPRTPLGAGDRRGQPGQAPADHRHVSGHVQPDATGSAVRDIARLPAPLQMIYVLVPRACALLSPNISLCADSRAG